MAILNYTTTIKASDTVAQIQALLSAKGAHKIMLDYENGMPVAISFQIKVKNNNISFVLPANFRGVKKAIAKQTTAKKYQTEQHAINVCWRIIKDWIVAQMAIVEAEQADMATIFLPYAVMKNNKTVSDNFLSSEGEKFLLT